MKEQRTTCILNELKTLQMYVFLVRKKARVSGPSFHAPLQGLLELLWTVFSEGKLQSCLKLRNFQNPFN